MALIKKLALGSIFISILSIFAMSHNANALSTVLDLSNYELVQNRQGMKINCTFSDMNNNVLTTQTDVWECSHIGDRNGVKLREIYTTDTLSVKKDDVLEYDVVVWSQTTLDILYPGFIGYSPNFYVLGFNQVADNVFNLNVIDDGYSTINGSGYYSIFRYTLKARYDLTTTVGFLGSQNFFIFKNGPLNVRLFNINLYRYQESQENKEVEEKTQEAVDDSEDAGADSSSAASSGGANLLTAITGFFNVITSAQPTNCRFNAPLNTYFGNQNLNVDLCALDLPSGIGALTSIIAIGILIPFAIHMFNKFISLFRSFQS